MSFKVQTDLSFEDFLAFLDQGKAPGFTRENVAGAGEDAGGEYYEQSNRNEKLFMFLKDNLPMLVSSCNCGAPALQGVLPYANRFMVEEYGWKRDGTPNEQDRPRQLAGIMIKFLLSPLKFEKREEAKLEYFNEGWKANQVFMNCSVYDLPKQ
jgi:hypothetical protein